MNNTRELLCMAAVYFGQDFSNKDEVKAYLSRMFSASHFYTPSASASYKCTDAHCSNKDSNGRCKGHKDLTITITALGFDELFSATLNASGVGDLCFAFETGGQQLGQADCWYCENIGDGAGMNYGMMSTNREQARNMWNYIVANSPTFKAKFAGLDEFTGDIRNPFGKLFNAAWRGYHTAAETAEMEKLQREWVWNAYGAVWCSNLKNKTGVDMTRSRALQEVALSRAVHRGAYSSNLFGFLTSDLTDEQIIDKIYNYEETHLPGFSSRWTKERQLAKTFLNYTAPSDGASNNINVGTATARIVPPEGGISVSSQDVPFNIVGIDLSNATVTFSDNITWSGAAVEPEPTVIVDGKTLVKDTDYTITYSNNIFTADDFPTKDTTHTATAAITGIGNYIGSLTKDFEVEGYKPDGWDSVDISLSNLVSATIDGTFVYNGTEHNPTPKLVYHFVNPTTNVAIDYDMVEGEDFKIVSYADNVNVGTAKIVVEGIGAFENTKPIFFDISPCELSSTTIADIPSFEYCKKDICPDVEIKVGDTVMTNGVDYDLSYENNRNRGTATVTITGKGNLTGVTTKNFEITPRDGSKFVYIIWL